MPFFAGGLVVIALALPVILILGILVILALRHDDDADAQRAPAIYGSVIAYLAILTVLFAGTGVVHSLLDTTSGHTHAGDRGYETYVENDNPMMGDDMYRGGVSRTVRYSDDDDGAAITEAVGFFLAGAAALGLLAMHRRLFARRHVVAGAASRVHRAYLLVMCFTVVLIGIGAAVMAVFGLYEVIFKDAANIENRADELRELIPSAVLAIGSWAIWTWHWRELDLDLGGGEPVPPTAADAP